MTKRDETIAHNLAAINRMRERQSIATTAGAECPTCGGGVNPVILKRFGHCLTCQRAAFANA